MIPGLYSTVAGMINQQTMLEVIANNLANVNTIGYKKDDLNFSGIFNPLPDPTGTYSSLNLDEVSAKFVTDFSDGEIRQTDNPLDLALVGDGFFVIQHPNGIRYTRSGNFTLNNSGLLVTIDGYPVLGTNGVIQIQGGMPEIDSSGQIIVNGTPIAKLRIVSFRDNNQLSKSGYNTFVNNNQAELISNAEVKQGYLELSNSNAIQEMVKMIETMRIYESYQKTIQLFNETLEKSNNELGKINA
ncbi:TPA: flagellar basal-body rod protein FlgF [Candidatus Poribacteria bacterium]|nr:flagellar basal-body rod protein FlgF [Candidatus Poribacteria bacterium]